jgi:superfamily II RNA helicase
MPVICSPVFPQIEEDFVQDHFAGFGFPLSDFQKHAINAIVNGNHVLVCAPTGSGKTLPAEFAIRHFISQGRRVIYTSPIKALSNQKYHEFSRKFAHLGITVGLCTGDIKTNPTADLLIMTAEILNNRLFQSKSTDLRHTSKSIDLRQFQNEERMMELEDSPEGRMRHTSESGDSSPSQQISTSSLSFEMNIETELAAVIMDEVHYINDESRGHVWEQTILTLPPQVQMIMLSATLDGPEKFAEWIESTRQSSGTGTEKRVYLAQTPTRIVPLSHYAYFPAAPLAITKAVKTTPFEPLVKQNTNTLISLQTAKNVFQLQGYKTAVKLCDIWAENTSGPVSRKHILNSLATFMKGSDGIENVWTPKEIEHLKFAEEMTPESRRKMDVDDTMLPAIVFTFSRKQVEESAADITANILSFDSKIPYTAAHECEQILRRLPNWREYMELPEYKSLVQLLEKGVGIHHSGMIPILREIVELRISEKKIFLLFATESFAIGLDCPIRTAVFTGITKFDGAEDRFLYAHEYTQMAGRAGRRGIDTVGHVIHLPLLYKKGIPSETAYRTILSNKPQKLVSKFHIDYKMVLSLLKKGIRTKFEEFAERSMTKTTIVKDIQAQERELSEMKTEYMNLQNSMQHIRTPLDKCDEYDLLGVQLKSAVNKKRKDIERRMQTIKDQCKYILEDIGLVKRVRAIESEIQKKEREIVETNAYMKTQTNLVCRILQENGILETDPTDELYRLTSPLGIIAAQFAEVHPVPLAKLIVSTNWFAGYTAKQLIGLLSVFVDVRLPEQQCAVEPNCGDKRVETAIVELQTYYDTVRDMEIDLQCYTGISYTGALCYDMADIMMEWCDLGEEETECKTWLRDLVAANISAGDFAKACMKLSATAKELSAMCETLTPVVGAAAMELSHTLAGIDTLILKHIATTQSLYL